MKTFMIEGENSFKEPQEGKVASTPCRKRKRRRVAAKRTKVTPRKLFQSEGEENEKDNEDKEEPTQQLPEAVESPEEEHKDDDDESLEPDEDVSEDGDVFADRFRLQTPAPSCSQPSVDRKKTPSQATSTPNAETPPFVRLQTEDTDNYMKRIDKKLRDLLPSQMPQCAV